MTPGRLASVPRALPLGVLLVGNFLSGRGGSRGVCEDLAERLAASGLLVHTTSRRRRRTLRLADMLAAIALKRHAYAVAQVDVYSGRAFFWAEAACSLLDRLGKPYLLTLHGGGLPQFAARWPRRVRRLLAGARTVTSPSRFLQRELSGYHREVELLPNPIDLAAYPYRPRVRPGPELLWLRAIHEVYNPGMAVAVLARVRTVYPAARLVMFGPVKQAAAQQRLELFAAELGVLSAVHFGGGIPKPEVPTALERGDIFLNTSNVDNAPVSVLEPMAAGLPVVSTDAGGIPDLLSDGEHALLVPTGAAEAMAAAVCRLREDDGLAAALSDRARRLVEGLDWPHVLPRWLALLHQAARRSTPRP